MFCPRQCALIHVEQIWAEDGATAQGRLLHERVDAGGADSRPAARTERNVALRSWALGVTGRADVVEYIGRPRRPVPVEYKRGKPKAHRADEIQLCAQAICLEEMSGFTIPEGALFYGETRRRQTVAFDPILRAMTAQTAQAARAMIAAGRTPPPVFMAGCRTCSLQEACQPKRLQRPPAIAGWLAAQLDAPLYP